MKMVILNTCIVFALLTGITPSYFRGQFTKLCILYFRNDHSFDCSLNLLLLAQLCCWHQQAFKSSCLCRYLLRQAATNEISSSCKHLHYPWVATDFTNKLYKNKIQTCLSFKAVVLFVANIAYAAIRVESGESLVVRKGELLTTLIPQDE